MAKMLRTAGMVVAAVALVAMTAGAAAPAVAATATTAASAGGIAGVSAATLGAIGAYGGLAAAALTSIAAATAPGMSSQGTASKFQTNPQSGLPYAMGRTRMSGLRFFAATNTRPGYTKFNDLLWFGALLSIGGPIEGIEKFTADGEVVTFDASGNANGNFRDYMAQKVHLGGPMATALNLSLGGGTAPGWTAQHKLSGITHAMWCLRYNKQGEMYGAGAPEPAWIGKWVKVYDPRLDSTYPGGSGPCRALQESTYVWSDNPGLHALTWALGRWQNGERTCGIGAPVETIRMAEFVECANVCEANGWKVGGVEWTTDSKWDTLKRILQAGGARPTQTAAMIGCLVNTPRTAIATIESRHLHDGLSLAATKSRRERISSVIPRYVDEDSDWELISGTAITVAEYATADKGKRTKEIDFPLVQVFSGQEAKQPGQLAAYEIVNSREAGPWTFTTGPEWIGLKTGDVVYLNVPEEGLVNQPVMITRRAIDPSTGKVSFAVETETYAKHAFALGETTTPPAPWSPTAPDLKPPAPVETEWRVTGTTSGEGFPALLVAGDSEMPSADAIVIDYRLHTAGETPDAGWTNSAILSAVDTVRHVIAPLESQTAYDVRVSYRVGTIDGDTTIFEQVITGVGKITTIENQLGDQADLIDLIDDAVGEAQNQIGAIQGEIATIRSDVTEDLDAFGDTVASLESDLEDVRERAERVETRQMAGSPNLLPNGGQESGLEGYYAQGCTLAVNDGSFWGRYLAVQSSGSSFLFNSPMAPAEAGVTFTGALDTAFFASTGLMQVHLIFVAAAGGEIPGSRVSSPKFGGHNFDSSNARRDANAVTGLAPAGTANVLLQVEWTGVSGLVVASARMLKIEAAPTWSPFTIEAQNLRTTAVLQTLDESYAAIEDRVESAEGSVETLMEALTNGDGTVVQVRTRLETAEGEIEDLQQIVTSPDGTLAKMQQRIAADAPNMVSNGGLDDEMTGFSSSDQLTLHDTPEWGRWLRVTGAGSTLRINGPVIDVGEASTITGAVDTAFAAASGQMRVHLIFVDANGVEISGTRRSSAPRGGHNFDNGNTGRAANAVTGSRPANAPRALLQVEWTGVSGLVVAGLRMLKMEAAATWSPFSSEAQVLQRATAFRGLESSYASLSEEVEAADGKAQSALDVSASLQGTVASLNQRVSVGSPNLIENGGLEDGVTGYGSDAALGVSTGTTWGRWLSAVSGASSFYVNGPVAPADPGVSYTGSMDSAFSASAGLQYNQLIFLNAAGAEIGRSPARTRGGHNFDATTAGRDANATTRVAPTGTAKVLMQTRWEGVVGLVVAGMRMCKIEAGSTWSPYSNEAAAALTMTAARTAQGNYAALSQTVEAQGVDVENIIEAVDNLGGRAAMMVRVDSDGVRRAYGIEVNGTPIGGGVDINADYFRLSRPGGGPGVRWDSANGGTLWVDDGAGATVEIGYLA